MNTKSQIPSDDEFAAASKHMEAQSRGTTDAAWYAKEWLKEHADIYEVYIVPEGKNSFRAYIFFEHEVDKGNFISNPSKIEFEEFTTDSLALARAVTPDKISMQFEYDSDENIQSEWDGDYYARMS